MCGWAVIKVQYASNITVLGDKLIEKNAVICKKCMLSNCMAYYEN